ncbi:MAG: LysM peptidoglycan-binding domain-containing protein [Anaerolineales bacterium]
MKIRNVLLAAGLGGLMLLAFVFTLAAAPGTAQAAPAAQAANITVTVKAGDSLSKFSRWFGVGGSALVAANHFKDPNLIFPGEVVVIPVARSNTPSLTTPFFYVVQAGDDLISIGRKYEIDPSIIGLANHLTNNVVVLGSTILIPAGPHNHIALAGETLKSIAARYGVPVSFLIDNNPSITNPDLIFSGQPIFIPVIFAALPLPITGVPAPTATTAPGATPAATASGVAGNFIQVTVHSGESFITYVARYGVNRRTLRLANPNLADPNLIFPGDIIIVPVAISFSPSRTTPFFYVVKGGETAAGVAAKFELATATLSAANPGLSIAPGATILVPAGPHAYTVKAGDTLTSIAAKYGTTADVLIAENKLANSNVGVGQVIVVPVQIDHAPLPFD